MKPIIHLMNNMVLVFAMISCAVAQPPVIRGIASSASGGPAVVPQMLVSIYGSNLAVQTAIANVLPLTTQLGGTSVAFNGIAAPLLYVSSEQINAQVPSGVQGSINANVIVTTAAGNSSAFLIPVNSGSAPGIFTQDSSGCGQAAALNIHADGSTTPNTPQSSFDPQKDAGLAIFMTGLGSFSDRADGVPWSFNAADNRSTHFGATTVGVLPGIPGWLFAVAANVNQASTNLAISYAGPAPGLVGVDQVNALYFNFGPLETIPLPEGCRVPLSVVGSASADLISQPANVSIHSGGGACSDTPAGSLGIATWQQNVTSDTSGVSTSSNVAIQFIRGPGIIGFGGPPVVFVSSFEDYGPEQPPLPFCAASYPATLDAGTLIASGPGRSPAPLEPQNQNGVIGYEAVASIGAIQAGKYSISTAAGGTDVGPFAAEATLPSPIAITTDLRPGKPISLPFTLNWTGGGADSVVTVELKVLIPGDPTTPILSATSPATAGTRTLVAPPSYALFTFPPQADLEILVTQQPSQSLSNPFSASGLTMGGEQSWKYVFDFKGLTAQ
jgi:uncharacterized protein (TIGR03437 family)